MDFDGFEFYGEMRSSDLQLDDLMFRLRGLCEDYYSLLWSTPNSGNDLTKTNGLRRFEPFMI